MAETLKYKDYLATVYFSSEDELFHGKVIGVNDLISFEGQSVKELKKAFKEAVDDYLITCKELNKQPDKTYKGSFNVRIPVPLHKKAAIIASQKNITMNEFMKLAISYAIQHEKEISRDLQMY